MAAVNLTVAQADRCESARCRLSLFAARPLSSSVKSATNNMAIVIKQSGSDYEAVLTPPHIADQAWQSLKPMPARELIAALVARGCHQTDVGDAFYAANPNWLSELVAQHS
jgi:hypothetical protein